MITEMYERCFSYIHRLSKYPNSLFQDFYLKEEIQIVFKENKGWIFDYENSVLYTLTQMAALYIYAMMKGHPYREIVSTISHHYDVPLLMVDSNFQDFLSEMYKYKLIKLGN